MAKLYFKYGAMGSCKSVNALTTAFNYEEKGMKVWVIKPATDNRDGVDIIKSRIGLKRKCDVIKNDEDIISRFANLENHNEIKAIVCDECQFLSESQIDDLRYIVDNYDIPVLCFGLRTDFALSLFPGSKRLFELADTFEEIKTICKCGRKATVNARIDENGKIITEGAQVAIGGNESYVSVCHRCYENLKKG